MSTKRTLISDNTLEIRKITPEEAWPIRHRVMWPGHPFDFVKVEEDPEGLHYGLFVKDELVSIVSLFVEGDKAQFRKFATEVPHQGKGYGTCLLNYLIEQVESMLVSSLWCNARVEKAGYYERFGFRKTERTYEKGGIAFVVMERFF